MITGDDILIEYVDRLMNAIRNLTSETLLNDQWKQCLEKFITHYVWHGKDTHQQVKEKDLGLFWVRLEGRLNEMQERRRRLIKYLYKKGKTIQFKSS